MLDFKPYIYLEGPVVNNNQFEAHIILRLPHNYNIVGITGNTPSEALVDVTINTSSGLPSLVPSTPAPTTAKGRKVVVKVRPTSSGIGEITFRYFTVMVERQSYEEALSVVVVENNVAKGRGSVIYADPD